MANPYDEEKDSLKGIGRSAQQELTSSQSGDLSGLSTRARVHRAPPKATTAPAAESESLPPYPLKNPAAGSGSAGGLGVLAGGNDLVNESARRGNKRKRIYGDANPVYGRDDLPVVAPAGIGGGDKPVSVVNTGGAGSGGMSDLQARASEPPASAGPAAAQGDLPGARIPRNDDPLAKKYLAENSRPTQRGELDVNNPEAVPGLDGVGYAGRYGQTDVFTGRGDQGQRSFSDLDNLAATRGGVPAAAPKGVNVVSNDSLAALSPSTSEQLAAARQAAADRGDWDAVERSFMTAEERAKADQESELAQLRSVAMKEDPAAVYEAELARLNSGKLDADDLYRLQRDAYQMQRDATSDRRTSQRDAATRAKQAIDILKAGMTDPDPLNPEVNQEIPLREYEGIVGSIVQERPNLLPDQIAAEARRRYGQYQSVMDA